MSLPGVFLFVPESDDHITMCLDLVRDIVARSPQGPAYSAGQDQAAAGFSESLHNCGIDPSDERQAKAMVVGMLVAIGTFQANPTHEPANVAAIMGAMMLRLTEGLEPPPRIP